MSVSPLLSIPPPAEAQAEQVVVRLPESSFPAISGSTPSRESVAGEKQSRTANLPEDEVKVQIEPPGEIAVYQFLNQEGTLVLQVPPQQVLNLAAAISKQLDQESVSHEVVVHKGENSGH